MVRTFQAETHMSKCVDVWRVEEAATWLSPRASGERVAELGLERKQRVGLRETCMPWRELELCSMEVLSHLQGLSATDRVTVAGSLATSF